MSDFITVPSFNHSFELVGAGKFSSVDWPIGGTISDSLLLQILISTPESQAHHMS